MLVRVRHRDGGESVELIGSITLVTEYDHVNNSRRQVPGTEQDTEGLHIDKFPWRGETPAWHGAHVIAWASGLSELLTDGRVAL